MEEKKPVTEVFTEHAANVISNVPLRGGRLAVAMRHDLEKEVLRNQHDLHNVVDDIQQQLDDDMKHEVNFGKGWRWLVRILFVAMILGGVYQLAKNNMELKTLKYKYDSEVKKQTEAKTSEQGAH